MTMFILRRLLQTIPLLLGITIITFAIANLVPGSPVTGLEFNPRTSQADIDRIKANLGLDEPLHTRYLVWVGNVVQGDLGISLKTYRPVRETIMEKLPNTLLLTGTALLLSVTVA